MSVWPMSTMGEIVKFVSGGTPNKDVPKYWGGEIPWVSSGEMSVERIFETSLTVTDDGVANGAKLAPKDSIFLVVRGMSLAKEFRVSLAMRDMTFNQDVKAIYPSKELEPHFLYYYLKSQSNAIRDSASEAAHGTKKLDMPVLEQWPVPIPPKAIQNKIAAILSAYDDLIENNKRRIALLEKMVEEIYREWFVRFRFPGYQNAQFEKGIPKGWGVSKLPEIAKISYGYPFKSDRFNCDGIGKPIVRIRNIPISSTDDFTDEVVDDRYLIQNGDILIGMDGEFHINHWYGEEAYLVQRVCKICPRKSIMKGYVYRAIRRPVKHYESILMGATVGHLGAKHLNDIDVLIPPVSVLEQLSIFNDLEEQKRLLELEIRHLGITKNMLLPRLISGKLSVEDLDIEFPPSMQEAV